MSTFTEREIEYLRGQLLGRLATVGRDGSPHVVPVGFRLGPEDEVIEIGGFGMRGSKKWPIWRPTRPSPSSSTTSSG